jgi:hypothetical protein
MPVMGELSDLSDKRRKLIETALSAALDRYDQANADDESSGFGPLGESLYWIITLADWHKDRSGQPLINALRYARDQITHRPALDQAHESGTPDEAMLMSTMMGGSGLPTDIWYLVFDDPTHRWPSIAELPSPPSNHAKYQSDYVSQLTGRPIAGSLREAHELLLRLA